MNPLTCLSRNKKENTSIQCWTFNGNWMTQKKNPSFATTLVKLKNG